MSERSTPGLSPSPRYVGSGSLILKGVTGARSSLRRAAANRSVNVRPVLRERGVRFGTLAGRLTIPDAFDAPLPDDILDEFEGGAH